MGQIETCTDNLIQAILESEEYQGFCEVRRKVAQVDGLKEKIDTLRLNVFETQNSNEPIDLYDEQARLYKKYEELRKDPLVYEFLRAELRVCRIIQQITLTLAEKVDLDTREIAAQVQI